MSKFKARSKKTATPVATEQTTEQTAPATPVVASPVAPVATSTGRTIVDIARELKITPQNARRVARKHAEALGHGGKGARWLLNAEQEKALKDALTRELTREKQPAVAQPVPQ
jgi:predicted transcriptional regulator